MWDYPHSWCWSVGDTIRSGHPEDLLVSQPWSWSRKHTRMGGNEINPAFPNASIESQCQKNTWNHFHSFFKSMHSLAHASLWPIPAFFSVKCFHHSYKLILTHMKPNYFFPSQSMLCGYRFQFGNQKWPADVVSTHPINLKAASLWTVQNFLLL